MLAFCAAVLFACIPEPVDIEPAPLPSWQAYRWIADLSDGTYSLVDEHDCSLGYISKHDGEWYWTPSKDGEGLEYDVPWLPPPPTPWHSRKHVPFIVIQPQ